MWRNMLVQQPERSLVVFFFLGGGVGEILSFSQVSLCEVVVFIQVPDNSSS